MCIPPPPVLTVSVFGNWPCSSSSALRLAKPWWSTSTSRIRSPLRSPAGIPMLASGHRDHHRRICPGSVVAPTWPFGIKGCFPVLPHSVSHEQRPWSSTHWSGKTGRSRPAYQRAAARRAGCLLAPHPDVRFSVFCLLLGTHHLRLLVCSVSRG